MESELVPIIHVIRSFTASSIPEGADLVMSRLRRKIGFVKCCHSEPEGAWEEEPCTLLGYDLEYFFRVYVSVEVVEREVDMVVVRPVASRASRRVERAIAAFPASLARVRRVRHITCITPSPSQTTDSSQLQYLFPTRDVSRYKVQS